MNNSLILASSSPRRLELLKKINITPKAVISPDIDESVGSKERPYEYVKRVASEKARIVSQDYQNNYILSADTIVLKGLRILGKPKDINEAKKIITLLSGGKHYVLTAFCIITPSNKKIVKVVKTHVSVKRLNEEEITWYLNTNEWQDKSGAYAIQGCFEVFVKRVNGSISSIVGLPLMEVYNTLKGLGYNVK